MNREHPTGTERTSLTEECEWKGGDRGGLAEREKREKNSWKEQNTLDRGRPSHGRNQRVKTQGEELGKVF
jgi:hypothetical protein